MKELYDGNNNISNLPELPKSLEKLKFNNNFYDEIKEILFDSKLTLKKENNKIERK